MTRQEKRFIRRQLINELLQTTNFGFWLLSHEVRDYEWIIFGEPMNIYEIDKSF